MGQIHHIVRLIDTFATARDRSPVTVGKWVSGDGGMYRRLAKGRDVTTRRADRITQWLSDHWPESAEWPSDIPRPPPASPAEDAA